MSEMKYEYRGKPMTLVETILDDKLPEEHTASYKHPMMENTLITRFEETADSKTRYSIEVDYYAINGIVPRLLARFFPKMFTSQGKKWMERFKQFAESQ